MHGMARNDPEEGEMDETALKANAHFVDFISLVFIFWVILYSFFAPCI